MLSTLIQTVCVGEDLLLDHSCMRVISSIVEAPDADLSPLPHSQACSTLDQKVHHLQWQTNWVDS